MSAPDLETQADATGGWRRLDRRVTVVALSAAAIPAVGVAGLSVSGGASGLRLLVPAVSVLVAAVVIAVLAVARVTTTRFRIVGDWFEVRAGLLFRTEYRVPLARIASADITRTPLHRMTGLATLRIGTGDGRAATERRLTLDGLRLDHAHALRPQLLAHTGSATVDDPALVRLDRSWIRYAPLSLWGVGTVVTAAGSAYRLLSEFGYGFGDIASVLGLAGRSAAEQVSFGMIAAGVATVAVGTFLSVAAFVENWSNYALDRGADGLRMRRGLLTTRSVTVPWTRIDGVELIEPLLYRFAGAAATAVIATGLGTVEENRKRRRLSPALPRPVAVGLADEVVRHAVAVTGTALRPHPVVAAVRRRRFGLAVVGGAVAVLLATGSGTGWAALYAAAAVTAIAGFTATALISRESHRSLGHALSGQWLLLRAGVFPRRTVALRTNAVIGWGGTRSPFQRRHGLLTLTASTAAGEGVYRVRDIAEEEGIALIRTIDPTLLKAFEK